MITSSFFNNNLFPIRIILLSICFFLNHFLLNYFFITQLNIFIINFVLFLILLVFTKKKLLIIIFFQFYFIFFILSPIMIERSGTVFIYYLLDQKNYNQLDLESKIEEYYVNDFTKKRIDEGLATGNIMIHPNGDIELTARGKLLVKLYKLGVPFSRKPIWKKFDDKQ